MLFAVVSSPASSSVPALAKISASVNPDSSALYRRQDGLQEVGRRIAPFGLGRHALPRGADHVSHLPLQRHQRPVERAVRGQADVAPPGKGGVYAPVQHGEDLVEMLLYHRARRLQCVGIDLRMRAAW